MPSGSNLPRLLRPLISERRYFLALPPEQAWLEVAATDNYGLFVNGHIVGKASDVKTRVAGIYDIKRRLKAGTNVIAVTISRISYPDSAQLLVRGLIKEPGGRVTSLLSDEHWRVTANKGIVEGSEEWTSPLVDEQLWPHARRSVINGKPVPIAWVDTNPLLLQLPASGSWIMAENAGTEAVFSTSINADHARQEAWIQVASSGDVDLLVNGHLITPAIPSSTQGNQLPHLAVPAASASPSQSPEGTQSGASATSIEPAKTTPTASSTPLEEMQPEVSTKETEPPGKTTPAPFEPAGLYAYDISHWIQKGPNTIVATVRADYPPACLFANGFLVRKDGTTARFETNSAWQIGDQSAGNQPARSQRPIEFGKDGSAPWGYLKQYLARPVDHTDFATLAKYCIVILLTTIAVVAVWLLVSATCSCSTARTTRPRHGSRRALSWPNRGGLGFIDPSKLRPPIPSGLVISAENSNWRNPGPVSYSLASLLDERPNSLWLEEPDRATPEDGFPCGPALSATRGDYAARVRSALSQSRLHVFRSR